MTPSHSQLFGHARPRSSTSGVADGDGEGPSSPSPNRTLVSSSRQPLVAEESDVFSSDLVNRFSLNVRLCADAATRSGKEQA
jgi:hypothetical protein